MLVTDWFYLEYINLLFRNPLEIWFYGECYIRFCAEEYKSDNLANNYAHLANNSIGKYSKNFT